MARILTGGILVTTQVHGSRFKVREPCPPRNQGNQP